MEKWSGNHRFGGLTQSKTSIVVVTPLLYSHGGVTYAWFQIQTDVTCDVDFNPKNPDVIVTIGKEHLMWWRFNPEKSFIEVHSRPDYEVS
jgi:hypothetical protein